MENPLLAFSNDLAGIAERAGRFVAAVHARPRFSSSGLLWQPGVIVTADHTLRREDDIRVTLPGGTLKPATIAGRDPGTDLAVLKIDGADAPPLDIAPTESLKTGNLILAVGRGEETGVNASLGVLSNVSGPWHTWRGSKIDQFLRLDVGLFPGASGGAIVDPAGRIIGIATSGLSRVSVIGIPAATIQRVAEQLLAKGHVARGFLGLGLQPIALPEHLRTTEAQTGGLIVVSVEPDGPAARAGVLLGDVLLAMNDRAVADTSDVQEFLSAEYVGKEVKLSLLRGGQPAQVALTIGERPRRNI